MEAPETGIRVDMEEGIKVVMEEAIKVVMGAGMGTGMVAANMVAAMVAAVHTDMDLGARGAVLMLMRPLMPSLKMMLRTNN